ncbi:helix-turn-helix domain-containing protein [Streptosporangium sp. NBC_01756]|uniref:helix-turn-helix domain-containing protein n=1 Tax=Streptosporangium sp. NBC_01756 TaxID=2975950 RepID=UPI002DDC8782|nr:helix-turn-helix domain-containing protein [Streptosporangium sp. NBC_01756]WSC85493.1 helix-turn-helix transcriptional regulator [Streptosporangium sp. NBC_01756]
MDFPHALRSIRQHRRLSQLDLALRAGTTQRHLSFMESGRSRPGRSMVVRLSESMELPLRERNELLLSAGYAPVYPQTPLDDPGLEHVRTALGHILTGHLPYPAIVVDARHELVLANDAFGLLTEGVAEHLLRPPVNVLRLALHPEGLAARIVNLEQWAQHILDRIPRDDLYEELSGYVPHSAPGPDHVGFAVPVRLRSARGELRLTTTITTFATALDVTVAELKLEAFLPADAATAALLAG